MKRCTWNFRAINFVLVIVGILFVAHAPANAQELGAVLRSDMGLKSGTQPGPGYYFSFIYYDAEYSSVRGPNGNALPGQVNTSLTLPFPAFSETTKWKLFGGNYGYKVAVIFSNQALTSTFVPISKSNTIGFGDIYIQPINLGWHKKRFDYLAAYAFHAPTGSGIRSLGFWTHEIIFGTTYYLDAAKKWSVAANGTLEIHQPKQNSDLLVGTFVTVKGGIGRSFMKGAASAGLVYSLQYKITHDGGIDLPALLPNTLNRAYAVGPEVSFPFFVKGKTAGFIGARYAWEFNNSSNFQGNNLALNLTVARFH